MKIARFEKDDRFHIGFVVDDQRILSLNENLPAIDPLTDNYITVLADDLNFPVLNALLDDLDALKEHIYSLDEIKLRSPIIEPSKFICLGLNYHSHAKESGKRAPKNPMLFCKAPSAIIGPNDPIIIPSGYNSVDYEVELAAVIGTRCRSVEPQDALDYVFGYSIFNDVSERLTQQKDKQFFRAKSFDTFAPMGPWLETNIEKPNDLKIQLKLNNELKQDSNTSEMVFDVKNAISFISKCMTLLPGDVIGTGTPAGVGAVQRIFLKSGDLLELTIEKIGTLINRVQ